MKKRGVFFSTDALIALIIVILVVAIAFPLFTYDKKSSDIHYDIISVLSTVKASELPGVPGYLVTDQNNSVLEQMGEFYALGNVSSARELGNLAIQELEIKENIGIWYGNTLITSVNYSSYENADNVDVARQTISGIQNGSSVTGFSARAFIDSNAPVKYIYFGGYVGDGNISIEIDSEGTANSVELELAINNDFEFTINDNYVSTFQGSPNDLTPVSYSITDAGNMSYFTSGTNTIEIKGENLHIAGGFMKIVFDSNSTYQNPTRYHFPGIEGLVNLYDGFYVPGNLSSLEVMLHLNSTEVTPFLTIGNTTVYSSPTNDEEYISIDDSTLSSLLDYDDLSFETIPLRLGLENVSFALNLTNYVDVFSVTDLSGSMNDCGEYEDISYCAYEYCYFSWQGNCLWWRDTSCIYTGSCSGDQCNTGYSTTRNHNVEDISTCTGSLLDLAKEANNDFIDAILNTTGNKIGLVGYATTAPNSNFHNLSTNNVSLKSKVSQWSASGSTCICCGINKAANELAALSDPERLKVMVVMSDGVANVECSEQGTTSDLNGNGQADDGGDDAIQAACDAYDAGIKVHAIGFGDGADEATLQAIAVCGNGSYYFGDIQDLSEIYQEIAQEIIEAQYVEQTIQTEEDLYTRLYPDSYIEFGYTAQQNPFGLIITSEKQFSNTTTGEFSLPENSTIIETIATSYSGPKWTARVKVNGNSVLNLPDYGSSFITLGDPYRINIPNSLILQNNSVSVEVGNSPQNITSGSQYNKIIYTVAKQVQSFSPILGFANGCIWSLEFEDNSNLTITVPQDYSGSDSCYYDSSHTSGQIANDQDALQVAVLNLLKELDFDEDGRIDAQISQQGLDISLSEIVGIPFVWSTEVQVRIWS